MYCESILKIYLFQTANSHQNNKGVIFPRLIIIKLMYGTQKSFRGVTVDVSK